MGFDSVEHQYNSDYTFPYQVADIQIRLLQRLYDAGALKKPDCKHEDLGEPGSVAGMRRCKDCGLYVKTIEGINLSKMGPNW